MVIASIILGSNLGPKELALLMPVQLVVSYSSYLTLGTNRSYIKNFARFKYKRNLDVFSLINFQVSLSAIVVGTVILYFLNFAWDVFLPLICLMAYTVLKNYFYAFFRMNNKLWQLNVNGVLYGGGMLVSAYLATGFLEYLYYWSYTVLILILIFLLSYDVKNYRRIFTKQKKSLYNFTFSQSLRLSIFAISNTVLITFDRVLIETTDIISLESKGSYQLAEMIGQAGFIALSSIVFYYDPIWIDKLRKSDLFARKFRTNSDLSLFLIILAISFSYLFMRYVKPVWFDSYTDLSRFIYFITSMKILVLSINFKRIYLLTFNLELQYAKFFFVYFFGAFCLFHLLNYFVHLSDVSVPIFSIIVYIIWWLIARKMVRCDE